MPIPKQIIMRYKTLWKPNKEKAQKSQMFDFLTEINQKYNQNFKEYYDLHQWSIENVGDFWGEFWEYSNIINSKKYNSVVDDAKKMPGAKWFEGARLNYAENLLQRRDDYPAIIFRGEDKVKKTITYKELFYEVHRIA